jgi:phenylpyruvate tautomerase PptA (4-oxalocrotonate tautomerase family)
VDQFERLCFERQSNRRTENATVKRRHAMPLAKIHVVEGRYDQARIAKVSGAIQAALMNTLCVPPEDFYQLIFELPKNRFLHTSSFLGMHYTDDLIVLDVTFIHGRPKETRLALLKDINTRVAAAAGLSPDDMMIMLYEVPGENISFGQGEAQRANAVAHT